MILAFSSILLVGLGLASGHAASAGAIALLLILALLAADRRLLSFFREKRGYRFVLQASPWLVIYYLSSGLGFLLGVLAHCLGRAGRERRHLGIGAELLLANGTNK
ncbi:MAG: hypothetical protein WKF75_15200 [Singulisphaera sp.]